jgi:DNA-binding MarR family transcriptional regulator
MLQDSITRKLVFGFDRLAAALRSDQWSRAGAVGLNPTQILALEYVASRDEHGVRIKNIAEQLGVSQPTATDTIVSLERKGLIEKKPDKKDARATAVLVTREGRAMLASLAKTTLATETAFSQLETNEQADLLLLQIKLIRLLQQVGAIPAQRMCASCQYFKPYIYSDALKPHHCDFVNAAFGDRDLRLDCHDHEKAEASVQATTWQKFTESSSATLQAKT